jgi:hypothetical protein
MKYGVLSVYFVPVSLKKAVISKQALSYFDFADSGYSDSGYSDLLSYNAIPQLDD